MNLDRSAVNLRTEETLAQLRVRVLNSVFYAMIPLGGIMTVSGIAQELNNVYAVALSILYTSLYGMLLIGAFHRRLSYTLRTLSFLLFLYCVAASELWFFGLTPITALFLFAFVVFAGLLSGLRMGVAAFVLSLLSVMGAAILYTSGAWSIEGPVAVLSEIMPWITSGLCFLVTSATALITGSLLLRSLDRNMVAARTLVQDLRTEIAGRERAEEEVRHNEERFRSLIENVSDIILLANARGIIQYASPALERILGYPSVRTLGKNMFLRVHREDIEKVRQTGTLILAGPPDSCQTVECRLRHRDGSWRSLDAVGRRYDDPQLGTCIVINMRDITARKQAEEMNERLEQQLQQAQKMEATGRLAGGIAHDFNNLLQVILGHLDLILGEQGLGNPARAELQEAHRAAKRAAQLTNQLLAFSRRQIVQPVNLNLNDLIQGVFNMISRVLGEHIEAHFVPDQELQTVCVDPGQLEQVLMNLCMNAAQAMPAGGKLVIHTANVALDSTYIKEHPWAAEGQYALMTVTDTGCGMSAETMPRIFEPFFTTKEAGHGTGLGLAMVYGIVRQHNGLIQVESEAGKGSSFKIYIPTVQQPAQEPVAEVAPETKGGSETILVGEDEPMVLKLIAQILRRAGYRVLTAKDGQEALEVFNEHADRIDLVVLDVMMPRLGGKEAMERIQTTHPQVPFLFSSGYSETAIHTNFVIQERLRLVKKPYSRTDLLLQVRSVLDSRPPRTV